MKYIFNCDLTWSSPTMIQAPTRESTDTYMSHTKYLDFRFFISASNFVSGIGHTRLVRNVKWNWKNKDGYRLANQARHYYKTNSTHPRSRGLEWQTLKKVTARNNSIREKLTAITNLIKRSKRIWIVNLFKILTKSNIIGSKRYYRSARLIL